QAGFDLSQDGGRKAEVEPRAVGAHAEEDRSQRVTPLERFAVVAEPPVVGSFRGGPSRKRDPMPALGARPCPVAKRQPETRGFETLEISLSDVGPLVPGFPHTLLYYTCTAGPCQDHPPSRRQRAGRKRPAKPSTDTPTRPGITSCATELAGGGRPGRRSRSLSMEMWKRRLVAAASGGYRSR